MPNHRGVNGKCKNIASAVRCLQRAFLHYFSLRRRFTLFLFVIFFLLWCQRKSAKWPTQWNLSQNRHGVKEFAPGVEINNALVHRTDDSADVKDTLTPDPWTLSNEDASLSYTFSHTVTIIRPKLCGLDVQDDTRCDDARATLFGASTSVGQICSVADAVLSVCPETEITTPLPDNMPGTCCLDNVKTTANFGESVSTRA